MVDLLLQSESISVIQLAPDNKKVSKKKKTTFTHCTALSTVFRQVNRRILYFNQNRKRPLYLI